MPILELIPVLDRCCGCITDIKAATAIIAVLGIVTSPVVSWAIIRHAYVVKVSCAITTNANSPDVVDISLNNALSFGFGANAGLGASCLSSKVPIGRNGTETGSEGEEDKTKSFFVKTVKFSGWIVLVADVVFLLSSIHLISQMYKGSDKMATLVFLVSGLVAVLLTFLYGIMYVAACVYVGGSFPVLELLFAFIDLIIWLHFLSVVFSYYQVRTSSQVVENYKFPKPVLMILGFLTIFGFLTNYRIFQRY